MDNLLVDGLIHCRDADGVRSLRSLPEVLAGLASSSIESFPHLARHQRHAWHAFLVQLAAIALHKDGRPADLAPPTEPDDWRRLIRAITPEFTDDEPWRLVVDDLSRPAFMQAPVPEGTVEKWNKLETPDLLDYLITSKNHDLKRARIRHASSDHWIYALITLQTIAGYILGGKYGISRMNKGNGNRPFVYSSRGVALGVRFTKDLGILRNVRATILADHDHFRPDEGVSLLWLIPWNGSDQIAINALDPFFIEICRRVRMQYTDKSLTASQKANDARRLALADDFRGYIGDPWIPIRRKDQAAFTVGDTGFTYKHVRNILFSSEYLPSACQRIKPNESDHGYEMNFAAVTRGQGRTEGLHERRIPISAEIGNMLRLDEGRNQLGRTSERMIEDVSTLSNKCLKPAILAMVQGDPDKLNFKDDRAESFTADLSARVDEIFFPRLWSSATMDEDEAVRDWQETLVDLGREILRDAERSLPIPSARRYRALAVAEGIYSGSVRRQFPLLADGEVSQTQRRKTA